MSDPIVIPLPWTKPPLSQNARHHHYARASKTATALTEARYAIRATKPPRLIGAEVTLHYQPADRRRRDADNLASTLKICQDAIVHEGILPDDSWVCIPRSGQEIHPPDGSKTGRMWLELAPLEWPAS